MELRQWLGYPFLRIFLLSGFLLSVSLFDKSFWISISILILCKWMTQFWTLSFRVVLGIIILSVIVHISQIFNVMAIVFYFSFLSVILSTWTLHWKGAIFSMCSFSQIRMSVKKVINRIIHFLCFLSKNVSKRKEIFLSKSSHVDTEEILLHQKNKSKKKFKEQRKEERKKIHFLQ